MSTFDPSKYMGTWYELAHYPSWFQRNDNYNTMAEYAMNADGSISVHNSTIAQGKSFDSYGTAKRIAGANFRVDFPMSEVTKLEKSELFGEAYPQIINDEPNYVIDRIWTNCHGQYVFAIVTDPTHQSLFILSRYCHPSLIAYKEIMTYVVANYDRDRLVQIPHFHETFH